MTIACLLMMFALPAQDAPASNGAVASPAPGAATPTPAPDGEPQPAAPEVPQETQDRVDVGASGLIDVRFRDVDVFVALEMLSEQTQRNIVALNGVGGRVSMVLRKVTFEDALRAITRSQGLAYETRDNILYVFPPPAQRAGADAAAATEMRIFRLNYVSAVDAENFIKPLLDPSCSVTRSSPVEGGIGPDKEAAGGYNFATHDVLIVVAPKERLERIEQAIAEFDVRPVQVLVEATIMRATLNDQNALGIDFNTLTGIDFQLLQAQSPAVGSLALGTIPQHRLDNTSIAARTEFNDLVANGGFTFGVVKDRIAAFVRALEQVTDVTIMANPKILTLNKQRGEIIVGRRDGYLTTTVTQTAAVQTVEYLETGTKLVFRPFVSRDGYIRMEIHPEDSNGGLTAANLPFQETTEATSNIMLKDGHTVLIGGLFRERSTSSKSQVPGLGSIPVVGHLFGIKQDQTTREEVIILLTVHVLDESEDERAAFDQLSEDIERVRVGARKGFMGIGREQLTEARYQAALENLRAGKIDKAISNVRLALHLHPRHIDAIRLHERLLHERTWHAEGSQMRTFITELLRTEAGLPRRPVFERPDVDALLRREEELKPETPNDRGDVP